MKNAKRKLGLLLLAGLFGTVTAAAEEARQPLEAPAFSRAQADSAHDAGIALSKLNYQPGLHVVSLADSSVTLERAGMMRKQIAQQNGQGFYTVEAGEITDMRSSVRAATLSRPGRLARIDRAFGSIEEIQPRLLLTPVSLGESGLDEAVLTDIRLAGGLVGDRWTGLTRTFDVPNFGLIVLNETDHVAGNESVSLIEEWLNVEINGSRGTMKTAHAADGKATVVVGWANERKIYSLQLQPSHPDLIRENQERLVQIARGLVES
jgi:hypothetical protein